MALLIRCRVGASCRVLIYNAVSGLFFFLFFFWGFEGDVIRVGNLRESDRDRGLVDVYKAERC